ncbi:hypothetical protein KHW15_10210 [Pseudomonas syringae]|uniref:hypothetical protein n=1 Tax=Pseudomonas syringae group TaxID=136849 RepID=UPI0009B593FF|nr:MULTISPECIES: hypothetical protein [Pseudomonas syringae group]MBS7426453.1 hypothetical protein [Pseudomonas syringae]MBS7432480.1 hypothetical protein [Pseudomonas syringae]QVI82409.1 hypothetical protein KHW15_10210 [Pseudomonas syringae]
MKSNVISFSGGALSRSGTMKKESMPCEVIQAMSHDWGVLVDAYLVNAARIGDRFAAIVFCDRSGMVSDGSTVATQPVHQVATRGAFKLFQTLDRADHYVLVTEHDEGGAT